MLLSSHVFPRAVVSACGVMHVWVACLYVLWTVIMRVVHIWVSSSYLQHAYSAGDTALPWQKASRPGSWLQPVQASCWVSTCSQQCGLGPPASKKLGVTAGRAHLFLWILQSWSFGVCFCVCMCWFGLGCLLCFACCVFAWTVFGCSTLCKPIWWRLFLIFCDGTGLLMSYLASRTGWMHSTMWCLLDCRGVVEEAVVLGRGQAAREHCCLIANVAEQALMWGGICSCASGGGGVY